MVHIVRLSGSVGCETHCVWSFVCTLGLFHAAPNSRAERMFEID